MKAHRYRLAGLELTSHVGNWACFEVLFSKAWLAVGLLAPSDAIKPPLAFVNGSLKTACSACAPAFVPTPKSLAHFAASCEAHGITCLQEGLWGRVGVSWPCLVWTGLCLSGCKIWLGFDLSLLPTRFFWFFLLGRVHLQEEVS